MSLKRQIAHLVCPSAPFLLPLRARNVISYPRLNQLCAAYHRSPPPKGSSSRVKRGPTHHKDDYNAIIEASKRREDEIWLSFRRSLSNGSVNALMDFYPIIARVVSENHRNFWPLVRTLHRVISLSKAHQSDTRSAALAFTRRLLKDVRSRRLPAHHAAMTHLIYICMELRELDDASQFWTWLRAQGDDYVNPSVYAAAIQLLTLTNSPLEEIEDLYQEALSRFPSQFAGYHFSPTALLPDRSQPVDFDVPNALLGAITKARVERGNWRKAYVSLDTALRLWPTDLHPIFLEAFMTKRPLSEAFKIFMVACRGGTVMNPRTVSMLLDRFYPRRHRVLHPVSFGDTLSMASAALQVLAAYVNVGGHLQDDHVTILIKLWTRLVPEQIPATHSDSHLGLFETATGFLIASAQSLVSILIKLKGKADLAVLNCLIELAGASKRPDLVANIFTGIEKQGMTSDTKTRHALMRAFANCGEVDKLIAVWRNTVSAAQAVGDPPSPQDWFTLIRASSNAGQPEIVIEQLQQNQHAVSHELRQRILQLLERNDGVHTDGGGGVDGDHLTPVLQSMVSRLEVEHHRWDGQIQNIAKRSQQISAIRRISDFDEENLPMDFDQRAGVSQVGTPAASREIYDRMTSDPTASKFAEAIDSTASASTSDLVSSEKGPTQANEQSNEAPRTRTNIRLDDLRYRNWAAINELLATALTFERTKADVTSTSESHQTELEETASGELRQWADDRIWLSEAFQSKLLELSQIEGNDLMKLVLDLRGLDRTQMPQLKMYELSSVDPTGRAEQS